MLCASPAWLVGDGKALVLIKHEGELREVQDALRRPMARSGHRPRSDPVAGKQNAWLVPP